MKAKGQSMQMQYANCAIMNILNLRIVNGYACVWKYILYQYKI